MATGDEIAQAFHPMNIGTKKVKKLNKSDVIKSVCDKCGNDDEYYFYYKNGERKCFKCKEQTV